jgi:hypothetical protein
MMKVAVATSVLLLSAAQAFAANTYQIFPWIQDEKGSSVISAAIVLDTNTGDIFSCNFEYSVAPIKTTSKSCTKGRFTGDSPRFPTGPGAMLATAPTNPLFVIIWKVDTATRNVSACASLPDVASGPGWLCATIPLPP